MESILRQQRWPPKHKSIGPYKSMSKLFMITGTLTSYVFGRGTITRLLLPDAALRMNPLLEFVVAVELRVDTLGISNVILL